MCTSFNFDVLHCWIIIFNLIVYLDGTVCISILHEPGEDQYGYERPEERWLPVHTVETIMLSVISMLSSPNSDSPANLEAAKEYREQPDLFKKKIQRIVRLSQENMWKSIRTKTLNKYFFL